MILYNVTVVLDEEIHSEWLNWIQTKYIDEVMAAGCFLSNRLLKVLEPPNEGVTYCVQYIAESIDKYREYQAKFALALQSDFPSHFADKFVIHRTILEFVN